MNHIKQVMMLILGMCWAAQGLAQPTRASATGGYVTVIKSTKTGKAMFMTSFRRLHRDEAVKQKEIARLINKQ